MYKELRQRYSPEEAHHIQDELNALHNLARQQHSIMIIVHVGDECEVLIDDQDVEVILLAQDTLSTLIHAGFTVVLIDYLAQEPVLLNDSLEQTFHDLRNIIPYRKVSHAQRYGLLDGLIAYPDEAQMN